MLPIKLRNANANDVAFVYDSFMRSFKADSGLGRSIDTQTFYQEMPYVIDAILSTSTTTIATGIEEDNLILGYSIADVDTLHYVFVKELYRKEGLGRKLILEAFPVKNFYYSAKTHHIKNMIKHFNAIYNPFKLYKKGIM